MSTVSKIKISLRCDDLSNWTTLNPILNNGELAIVNDAGNQKFKIGNGISSFSQLPFFNETEVTTTTLSAQDVVAKSISQGLKAKAIPLGFAAGAFLSANANFSQVLGFNAEATADDIYAFVWNGDDARALLDYYQSHGKGTFNINPADGLNGFYIGESSLSAVLSSYLLSAEISGYCTNANTQAISTFLSGQIADTGNLLSGYYSKAQTSSNIELETKFRTLSTYDEVKEQLSNDSYLTAHQSLTGYYTRSETSSKTELAETVESLEAKIRARLLSDDLSDYAKVWISTPELERYDDLSVIKIRYEDYRALAIEDQALSNAIYIVSADVFDNYGERIINVEEPIESADVATKNYVDQKLYAGQLSTVEDETEESGQRIQTDVSCMPGLSVVHIDLPSYGSLLSSSTANQDTVYFLEQEDINAFDQKIINVVDGTDDHDAATVGQLNAALGDINTILEALN